MSHAIAFWATYAVGYMIGFAVAFIVTLWFTGDL
jgi:hypothetical protein